MTENPIPNTIQIVDRGLPIVDVAPNTHKSQR